MAAWVPTLRKTLSAANTRFPPSFSVTSSVFGAIKTPAPHDQFGAARFVVLTMPRNLTFNHFAFASANRGHIDHDRTGYCAVFRGVARQMGNLRARNLALAGHAG